VLFSPPWAALVPGSRSSFPPVSPQQRDVSCRLSLEQALPGATDENNDSRVSSTVRSLQHILKTQAYLSIVKNLKRFHQLEVLFLSLFRCFCLGARSLQMIVDEVLNCERRARFAVAARKSPIIIPDTKKMVVQLLGVVLLNYFPALFEELYAMLSVIGIFTCFEVPHQIFNFEQTMTLTAAIHVLVGHFVAFLISFVRHGLIDLPSCPAIAMCYEERARLKGFCSSQLVQMSGFTLTTIWRVLCRRVRCDVRLLRCQANSAMWVTQTELSSGPVV